MMQTRSVTGVHASATMDPQFCCYQMPMQSVSLFHSAPLGISKLCYNRPRLLSFTLLAARRDHKNFRIYKRMLKVKDSLKETPSHFLDSASTISLSPNQAVGFVAASYPGLMRVIVESSGMEVTGQENALSERCDLKAGTELLCAIRGVLTKIGLRVLVGDKVLVSSVDWTNKQGMIENVFERSSEIVHPPVSNIDHLLVLFSMEQPTLKPFPLTRFLVEAELSEIPFSLALNKVDLVDEETLHAWKARLHAWGYNPMFCSVESKFGLSDVAESLKGKTAVVMGPTGAGKSCLINALRHNAHDCFVRGEEISVENEELKKWFEDQRVGEVSAKTGQGKHTTRNISLLPVLGGGYLVDTPGSFQPYLSKVTSRSLADAFPEIRKVLDGSEAGRCSSRKCLHLGEPGCVMRGGWERYPYYLELVDETKIREEIELQTFGTKREGEMRFKVHGKGHKQPEPMLEPKYRRKSRKRLQPSIADELVDVDDSDAMMDFDESSI